MRDHNSDGSTGTAGGIDMEHIVPKKSLGQNFLTDANIAAKIVREFAPAATDVVVEIGPGEGALTRLLAASEARVIAIEVDPRAAERIRTLFGDRIEVIEEDVLRVDLAALAARAVPPGDAAPRIRVLGNIPYYITSPILFHLIDGRAAIRDAMVMMQREVAHRLVARPSTKEYGILAVMTQTYATPRRLFDVGSRCFFPPPKVTSSVVSLAFHDLDGIGGVERTHRTIVRAAFNQRRKTLRNSLGVLLPNTDERDRIFAEAAIDPGARAEELAPAAFIRLAQIYQDAIAGGQRRPQPRE